MQRLGVADTSSCGRRPRHRCGRAAVAAAHACSAQSRTPCHGRSALHAHPLTCVSTHLSQQQQQQERQRRPEHRHRPRRVRCAAEPSSAPGPVGAAAPGAPGAAGFRFASAVSRRVNLDLALTEAAGAALKMCGEAEPDVAFVFASSAYGRSLDLLVPLLRRLLPTARVVVGCTGFGVMGAAVEGGLPEEVEHAPAVALALGAFPGVAMKLTHVQPPDVPDGGQRAGGGRGAVAWGMRQLRGRVCVGLRTLNLSPHHAHTHRRRP